MSFESYTGKINRNPAKKLRIIEAAAGRQDAFFRRPPVDCFCCIFLPERGFLRFRQFWSPKNVQIITTFIFTNFFSCVTLYYNRESYPETFRSLSSQEEPHMVEVIKKGAYLTAEGIIWAENATGMDAPEAAREKTIAYSILRAHDKSTDTKKMRIKFDALISHDITFVGIIQPAKASGLKDQLPQQPLRRWRHHQRG